MRIVKDIVRLSEDFPFKVDNVVNNPTNPENLYFHWHDTLEISFIKKGRGRYYVNGKIYEMHLSDIIIFNNIEPHAWEVDQPDPMHITVIDINPSIICPNESNNLDYEYLKPFINRGSNFNNKLPSGHPITEKIYQLLLDIENEYFEKPAGYRLMIKTKLLNIMTYLIRYFQDDDKTLEEINAKAEKLNRIQQAIDYIRENFTENLYLAKVASEAFMNPSYFSKFFKETLGVSFTDYITKLRIEKAKLLIESTNRTLIDIALESGFSSISNFYRVMNKVLGDIPGNIRKKR